MGKTVEDICNLIANNSAREMNFDIEKNDAKTLSSSVAATNPFEIGGNYNPLYDFDGLYNPTERIIVQKLANAIDKNSASEIKQLKKEYGNLKEFSDARKILNQKCKEVWSVYEPVKNLPRKAMKALGITNEPELDFLLDNSVKYYEKDNSDTTSYIISSILNNKNLSYTMDEIHSYLKNMNLKSGCKYNFKTVQYLITEQNYDTQKLKDLGVEDKTITDVLKSLSLKVSLKFKLNKALKNLKINS
ncbi:MAG: hypothetical protein SPL70_04675 [Cyanobacteriota bacterium]|nr:hypothetical protein [Cyanobacteriota bacterium]MDY6383178.1 hypothetical protein [Cyanobacteriota bacterium]